jgi:UDP-N-acetylglucosamine 4,6-dehydratase/5-epimerase
MVPGHSAAQARPRESRRVGVKAMLITGATGTLGSELVATYYGRYDVYAQGRDAQRLLKLQMRYPRLHLVLGDLRCHGLREAIGRCSLVVHAAAQKYVDLAELHPQYTVDTNVVCTHELAEMAAQQGVDRFVFISTDKSSAPTNVYGVSKYLAERLILELADVYRETDFIICRFGNIFGSNGSVVRLWLDAVRRGAPQIRVTDPEMTRFMFSVEDAVATVEFAVVDGGTGDIIIPKMVSVRLRDIISLFPEAEVQVVGKRPGEKTHETLYVKGEINTGRETDRYYVLNRRSTQTLAMELIDSTQVPPIEPARLRQWFDNVRKQAA